MKDDIQRVQAIEERQVTDAWQRVESWLRRYAPATREALRPGAGEEEIEALQQTLGVRIPAGLKALWRQCAGVYRMPGTEFLLDQGGLMPFDAVATVYRLKMTRQKREQEKERDHDDEFLFWRAAWIPFCSLDVDHMSGLCLNAETGRLLTWSRYYGHDVAYESLTTYLEEMADILEAPALAVGHEPGLLNGTLVWGRPRAPEDAALWRPFTGGAEQPPAPDVDFEALVRQVRDTGERVCLDAGGGQAAVLFPAAELAELDELAGGLGRLPSADDDGTLVPAPVEVGDFIGHTHIGGGGKTFTKDGEAVAILLTTVEVERLEERAAIARQSRMSPEQAAAFEEFLARQPSGPDA
ncbi:SMI1/KNR4 family protein [Streptomyces sp. NPDC102467]|uniref:SMI1/KNR4 family protein n=1 Tax=Streptomyces sp. NPDC102467 TaxID=3366179 RepID=UPI00381A436A